MSQSSYSVTPDTRHNRFLSTINFASILFFIHKCFILKNSFKLESLQKGREIQQELLLQVEQSVGEGSSTEVGPKKVEGGAAGGG